jgi:hypothetical protein
MPQKYIGRITDPDAKIVERRKRSKKEDVVEVDGNQSDGSHDVDIVPPIEDVA